ncbi:MAG: response regulator transcription factor [Gammaproteobacteria bacterium]|nr:response regulator transcription factor [Gammaproteobacteria bacterium]
MNKTKILIIEDDAEISRLTAMYLHVEGFDSHIIAKGNEAIDGIKYYQPDLVILDLMLPGMSGMEICQLAREFYQGPILVLTACDDDVSEVTLLKLGADDFLTKPLKPHVLVARIEAILRRTKHSKYSEDKHHHSKISINKNSNTVTFEHSVLNLTGAEYDLLVLLEKNIGQPVSRNACCQGLRGIDYDFNDRSIDMRISGLRKKLNDDQMPYQIITTVRNKGYMLING